jgi:RNA polymerase sigma-70 factor (ECF subfamily)
MPSSETEFTRLTDPHRRELLVHCYRMLGSFHDAEDVLQETYLRAWRAYPKFEGRSSVRTWLYRIATRACLTALESSGRRLLPSGLGTASTDPFVPLAEQRPEVPWLEPLPDSAVGTDAEDPATIAIRHESTRLAFVAALQELPARQRAALVLRDVLQWPAADVAELLELSVAAVNSALQRARAHLAGSTRSEEDVTMSEDLDADILSQFVTAFETSDLAALTALLRHDVELEMPPIPTWFSGRDAVAGFFGHRVMTGVRRRLIPTHANGCPAVATYQGAEDGKWHAHSIQVLEIRDGAIARIYAFLDPTLFESFALPAVLPESD